jgi:hypothetical protein
MAPPVSGRDTLASKQTVSPLTVAVNEAGVGPELPIPAPPPEGRRTAVLRATMASSWSL